jgi:tetratricopeptide (TPR) repeat protein
LSETNSALFQDLHRNRAIVNLCLGCYEEAEADARASIIKLTGINDSRMEQLYTKALYRAGRAAYELTKYQQADETFLDALELLACMTSST